MGRIRGGVGCRRAYASHGRASFGNLVSVPTAAHLTSGSLLFCSGSGRGTRKKDTIHYKSRQDHEFFSYFLSFISWK